MKYFILCLFLPFSVYASVGTITQDINAPGTIIRGSQTIEGKKGVGVNMNDTVNTTKGIIGITFLDDTKVEVNQNSKLVIDEFVYDPKESRGNKLEMKFASGTVRYASGAIAHNNPRAVALNTPVATVSVRGTDFTATVDDLGESTIILLPDCPSNWTDIKTDCKTGVIDVTNDAGSVTLDQPFQGTKVISRNSPPMKPVILHLTVDAINNLLIVAPPKELDKKEVSNKTTDRFTNSGDMLNVNFLKQNFLENQFQADGTPYGSDPLTQPLLQQYFLEDIFDILAEQLQEEATSMLQNLLAPQNTLLPDYTKASGVVDTTTATDVELCRNDGSNQQCIQTPKDQNSTIYQTQGSVTIRNRVNAGGNTTITLKQN